MRASATRLEPVDDEQQLGAAPASRASGFTQVSNAFLRDPAVTVGEKIVMALVQSRAWGEDSLAHPAQATLAAELGKSVDFVRDQLRALEAKGFLKRVRRPRSRCGRPNEYVVDFDRLYRAPQHDMEALTMPPSTVSERAPQHGTTTFNRAGQQHQQDVPKTQGEQHQGRRAAPDAVASRIKTGLLAWGVSPDATHRICAGLGRESAARAARWLIIAPELRAANVPAYLVTAIEKGWDPPARIAPSRAARVSAAAARELEEQAHADRVAAESAASDAAARSEALVATLPPRILAGLRLRAIDSLLGAAPAFVPHGYNPPAAKLAERVASLAAATAADGSWLAVTEHDELMHAQPGEASAPAFSGRCAGCCQVRDFELARRGDAG